MIETDFWKNKKVLVTGSTGFKGTWLTIWLNILGANILGYSLKPPTDPSLFYQSKINKRVKTIIGDVRNKKKIFTTINSFKPEIIFHLAAQSLVIESYKDPVNTFETNFNGTLNLLDAIKEAKLSCSTIIVTSDKCYENINKKSGYVEQDKMGGNDPYSASKGIVELLANSYSKSFFENKSNILNPLATVRAGNVIGGGDWSKDRIIPDTMRAYQSEARLLLRNPEAIRPWQHVLDPLYGYLLLASRIEKNPRKYIGAWNFGPNISQSKSVLHVVNKIQRSLPRKFKISIKKNIEYHEANILMLNSNKSKKYLNWSPNWKTDKAIERTVEWYKKFLNNENIYNACLSDIKDYIS